MIFSGPEGSEVNGTTDGPVTIHSITIDPSYNGSLDLIGGLTVQGGGFDMEGGSINQPGGSSSDISVIGGGFNWSAGDINNGTVQSNLQLLNLTSPAKIAGNFNRNFSDNLLVNGSKVLMDSIGQWTFNLGAGITISNGGTFEWFSAGGSILAPDGGQIANNGGTFLVPTFASGRHQRFRQVQLRCVDCHHPDQEMTHAQDCCGSADRRATD